MALLSEKIDFDMLPKTFRDAVSVTLSLGLEYLWIDSLCIIQDSQEDWAQEAARMADIYSQTYVNLAATDATDSTGGLFLDRNGQLGTLCLLRSTGVFGGLDPGTVLIVSGDMYQHQILGAPLNGRGWVLQERILAPRTVHFTLSQVWWTSNDSTETYTEWFPDISIDSLLFALRLYREQYSLPRVRWRDTPDLGEDEYKQWSDCWRGYVQEYSGLGLTKHSDKLAAISGISSMFSNVYGLAGSDYLAGHWRRDLPQSLRWWRQARCEVRGCRPDDHGQYTAPSWSWASMHAELFFAVVGSHRMLMQILDVEVNTDGGPFGPVKDGHLAVRGPVWRVRIAAWDDHNQGNFQALCFSLMDVDGNERTFPVEAVWDGCASREQVGSEFIIAPISYIAKQQRDEGPQHASCLLLQPTGRKPGEFERTGFAFVESVLLDEWMESCHGKEEDTICEAYDGESGGWYTYRLV
ncbi:hypothetical protein OQA88_2983 [Cercophora sp. LCS_1]